MNNDLISRREIKDHIGELILVYSGEELTNAILNAIDNAPTVDTGADAWESGYIKDLSEIPRGDCEKGDVTMNTEKKRRRGRPKADYTCAISKRVCPLIMIFG